MSRITPEAARAAMTGWSARDVRDDELVDDDWIAANTRPGLAPSKARHIGGRVLSAVRTIGVDPLEGQQPANLTGLLPKLPRPVRRALIQRGGLTRDQMRRIAARTGYPYVEAWSGHNRGRMSGVWGAMVHHTGTSWAAPGDYPTLRVVRDGRRGLENSLCGFGLGRSGTIYLISEKVSWHAGAGNWNGMTDGNGKTIGIEAESDGKNWTDAERDCYPRLVASILHEIGQNDRYTTRHASYALPRGRKVDASGLDMDLFWRQVYAYLANPAAIDRNYGRIDPVPPPSPAPPPPARPERPERLAWRLPRGHWYGNVAGPAASHGGINAVERVFVKNIQQWLIFRGCVGGVAPHQWSSSGWADGRWEGATDVAMRVWHDRFYRGQPQPTQCWADDYARLTG